MKQSLDIHSYKQETIPAFKETITRCIRRGYLIRVDCWLALLISAKLTLFISANDSLLFFVEKLLLNWKRSWKGIGQSTLPWKRNSGQVLAFG